jgi:nucleoside-diphosphate-sugar epimerase
MAGHAFVVGGTGQTGFAVASNLLEHGWIVTLLHRGRHIAPAGLIERGAKDHHPRSERTWRALASAIRRGSDAFIDTVAFTVEHARQLVALHNAVGTFVVVSSASVYREAAGRTLSTNPRALPDSAFYVRCPRSYRRGRRLLRTRACDPERA